MKKLRHAVIGAGRISKKHFAGYAELDNVETIAVCDNDKNLLNKVAETWGIAETTTDYKTILARGDIDFVSICLPNCFHAPVSIDALLAGKHVHCEKPMATDAESAAEMAAVAEKSGKVLMIALNNRFTIYAQYIKNLVNSGWLGDIYFAKCGWLRRNGLPYHGWFSEVKFAGGGALIDLGVHLIDMVMFMMDYPKVDTVSARTYTKFG
ncbi:MAG: Gfo/Idh/MocA family oxidoreductase, partial [Oscillospiraceae bacterium]|nr:Gfo/Idh/MocA family oxidoreductase [Oscillospiraceae bacterium]